MGASKSKKDLAKTVKHHTEFCWWTLHNVDKAWKRVLELCKEALQDESVPQWERMRLTRFQFREAFTDYDTIRGDTFLSLPQEVFTTFLPSSSATTINALELLLVLTLFSNSPTLDASLEQCFRLFDADDSDSIEFVEMKSFLHTMATASRRIGIVDTVPSEAQIHRLSEQMFADADENKSGDINAREFTNWARKHVVSQRVIAAFSQARATSGVDPSKIRSMGEEKRDNRASVLATGQAMARAAAARKRVVRRIAQKTKFGTSEMRAIKQAFKREAQQDGALSRDQFCSILTKMFRSLNKKEANELFTGFDADGGGELDFREFATGMMKTLRVPTIEKIRLLFVSLDDNDDGDVTISEVLDFVNKGNEEVSNACDFVEEIIKRMDVDGDGIVDRDEFCTALAKKSMLYETFTQSGLIGLEAARPLLKQLAECGCPMTLDSLRAAKEAFGGLSMLDIDDFVPGFSKAFQVPEDKRYLVADMFNTLDCDYKDRLQTLDVLHGLVTVMDGPKHEKAGFIFDLYDSGGDGEMERSEILSLVIASQEAAENAAAAAAQAIREIDVDGDGTLTLEEMEEAASKNPKVIGCLSRIFGVGTSEEDDKAEDARLERVRKRKIARIGESLVSGVKEQESRGWVTANQGVQRLRRSSMGTVATVIAKLQKDNAKELQGEDQKHLQASVKTATHEYVARLTDKVEANRTGLRKALGKQNAESKELQRKWEVIRLAREREVYMAKKRQAALERQHELEKQRFMEAELKATMELRPKLVTAKSMRRATTSMKVLSKVVGALSSPSHHRSPRSPSKRLGSPTRGIGSPSRATAVGASPLATSVSMGALPTTAAGVPTTETGVPMSAAHYRQQLRLNRLMYGLDGSPTDTAFSPLRSHRTRAETPPLGGTGDGDADGAATAGTADAEEAALVPGAAFADVMLRRQPSRQVLRSSAGGSRATLVRVDTGASLGLSGGGHATARPETSPRVPGAPGASVASVRGLRSPVPSPDINGNTPPGTMRRSKTFYFAWATSPTPALGKSPSSPDGHSPGKSPGGTTLPTPGRPGSSPNVTAAALPKQASRLSATSSSKPLSGHDTGRTASHRSPQRSARPQSSPASRHRGKSKGGALGGSGTSRPAAVNTGKARHGVTSVFDSTTAARADGLHRVLSRDRNFVAAHAASPIRRDGRPRTTGSAGRSSRSLSRGLSGRASRRRTTGGRPSLSRHNLPSASSHLFTPRSRSGATSSSHARMPPLALAQSGDGHGGGSWVPPTTTPGAGSNSGGSPVMRAIRHYDGVG